MFNSEISIIRRKEKLLKRKLLYSDIFTLSVSLGKDKFTVNI